MIAAIFVETNGAYFNLPGVDPWDRERDARSYAGPFPVVAHPPCERWGNFWFGGLRVKVKKKLGDDGGCFAAALDATRKYGGVLEHPAQSRAWAHFGITRPPKRGGWIRADEVGGWTCAVYQGAYGHAAYKPTWLYYVGPKPPDLRWGKPAGEFRPISQARHFRSKVERLDAIAKGWVYVPRLSFTERKATPPIFRDLLILLAQRAEKISLDIFGDLC